LLVAAVLVAGCFDLSELDVVSIASTEGGGAAPAGCIPEGVAPGVLEGDVMAEQKFKNRDGERISLRENCGRVTLLGFGAGWCIGCREEMPHFVKWQQELSEDLAIYYVLWQDNANQPASTSFAGEWADEYSANFPIVVDPTGRIRQLYAPELDLPTTILIDRHMVIRKIRFYATVDALRPAVDELLAE